MTIEYSEMSFCINFFWIIHSGIYIVAICLAQFCILFVAGNRTVKWYSTHSRIYARLNSVRMYRREYWFSLRRYASNEPSFCSYTRTLCRRWYPIVEATRKCQSRRRPCHVRSKCVPRLPCQQARSARRDGSDQVWKIKRQKRAELFRNYSFIDWTPRREIETRKKIEYSFLRGSLRMYICRDGLFRFTWWFTDRSIEAN